MQLTDLTKTLEDTAYVAIGFGVLAFQKAQVQRRDLAKQLSGLDGTELRTKVAKLSRDLEGRIDPVVDELQERLPAQAKEAVQTARATAKTVTEQLRSKLETAAA
ncbi:MAG TPA: hypothetical protein VM030_08925 [Acidimicrobiales bacterium]|nr:hypothetical protein [Acidimicrobiales bacterium]